MAKGPEGQMTVPELLEARRKVELQLESLRYRGFAGTLGGDPKVLLRADLRTILQEIRAELAEQRYKDD